MSIFFDKSTNTFFLEGKNTTYAFFINNSSYPEHLYYGSKIGRDYILYTRGANNGSQEAYTADGTMGGAINSYNKMGAELAFFGTGDYRECAIQIENSCGDRLSNLLYSGYDILEEKPSISSMPSLRGGKTLVIYLYDEIAELGANLYYTVYDDCDVIARRVEYVNNSDKEIKLHRAYSFTMSLPCAKYDAISLYGGWANERQLERTPLHHGVFGIDSKRGASSACLNPFMAIVEKDTTESFGNAYGFMLVYSGSFALKAEHTSGGDILVTGGINDFDFCWGLPAGEKFETPEVIIGYSPLGIGGMSREFHDALREHLIPKKHKSSPRPIVINNWEATYFDFTEEKLCEIADAAAGLGIDTFVLDDGWFGKRNNDKAGLGDWVINKEKLPCGLKPVIEHINSLGMSFGLWFEPEMINPDSDIFRAHPEYAIGVPGRERCPSRHQYVMDLTNPEVRDYIVDSVNSILRSHNISYVKWDYNRTPTEFYSYTLDKERQREFHHRYTLGVYDLFERIVNANPDIFFEGCASGGARYDAGVLAYFPQIWTSDNSDADMRVTIQYGTSIAYPLSAMSCHVSAVPNHQCGRVTPLYTRQAIASLGATGYELDMTKITKDERKLITYHTKQFRQDEPLILEGDLYRGDNPTEGNYFSETIVSKDKSSAMLITYQRLNLINTVIHRVKPQGLDSNKKYYCKELNLILSGSTLMNVGIALKYRAEDFTVKAFHFEEK